MTLEEKITETQEGNNLLANYLGWELDGSFYYTHKQFGIHLWNPMTYNSRAHHMEQLAFHESWDWLFLVIDKINGMGKEYSFATFKTYVSLTVEKGGKVYKDFSFAYSEYITATQTGKEATFKLLVKYVKWHNEQEKLKN